MTIVDIVRHRLPDFCWQTLEESLGYLEQIDDRITYEQLSVYLTWPSVNCYLDVKTARKSVEKRGRIWIKMYKRKSV